MADFIGPVVDWLVGVVTGEALAELLVAAELEAFAEVKQSWTGVVINWPPVSVMPRATAFDAEGTAVHGTHGLRIKFGVCGDDPDQIAVDAMAYMKAVDQAIAASVGTWPAAVSKVFVSRHDYGPLFSRDKGFAKFPELHLEVETYEI
jgi:hypothetical protein